MIAVKNQKLESLCRALQDQRKSLYEKAQAAEGHPMTEGPKEEVPEKETPEEDPASAAPAGPAAALESHLSQELAKLKAERALLKEIAGSYTGPAADATAPGASEGARRPAGGRTEQSDKCQEHLELEPVD